MSNYRVKNISLVAHVPAYTLSVIYGDLVHFYKTSICTLLNDSCPLSLNHTQWIPSTPEIVNSNGHVKVIHIPVYLCPSNTLNSLCEASNYVSNCPTNRVFHKLSTIQECQLAMPIKPNWKSDVWKPLMISKLYISMSFGANTDANAWEYKLGNNGNIANFVRLCKSRIAM